MPLLLINTLSAREYTEARVRIALMQREAGWRLRVYRIGIGGPFPLALQVACPQAPSYEALRQAWERTRISLTSAQIQTAAPQRGGWRLRRPGRAAAYRRDRAVDIGSEEDIADVSTVLLHTIRHT